MPDMTEIAEIEDQEAQRSRDRAIRLFEYLKRLAELRARTVRDLAEYTEVVWFDEIPVEPECRAVTGVPPGDALAWLTIERPRRTRPPELPEVLAPWVDRRELEDSAAEPELLQMAEIEVTYQGADGEVVRAEQHRIEEHPEVGATWARYRSRWQRWAAEDRRLKPIYDVYKRLFDVEQLGNQLGEQFETVLGIGLLSWSGPAGAIRRHLLTMPAELRFHAETGRISAGPPADGGRLGFEEDMLEGGQLPSREVKRSLDERLQAAEPWDRATVGGILRAWAHAADTRGSYEPSISPQPAGGSSPQVRFAPALILRRRSPRSLIDFYGKVVEQLRAPATKVPATVRDMIEILDDLAEADLPVAGGDGAATPALEAPTDGIANGEEPTAADGEAAPTPAEPILVPALPANLDGEVYFPLPSNDEQWRIVERLGRHRGVIVQGPPGTGKSHTIANLISHLAALGKRVLVTSHTGRALEVLKGKLPDDIAKLCVSVVGEGRRGAGDLERSVQALVTRATDPEWQEHAIDQRVADLRERLDAVAEERRVLLAEQLAIREREIQRHALEYGGYEGTLAEIAARLRGEEPGHSWLTERPSGPPPLSADGARELLDLLRGLRGETAARAGQAIPDADLLPEPGEAAARFEQLAAAEREAEQLAAARALPLRGVLAAAPEERCRALGAAVADLTRARDLALRGREPWLGEAVDAVLEARMGEWEELARLTAEGLESLADHASQADGVEMTGHESLDPVTLRGQARDLLAHLEAGGRVGGLLKAPPVKAARQLLDQVRVDGRVPDSPGQLGSVISVLDAEVGLARIERHWGSRLPEARTASYSARRARLADAGKALDRVLALVEPRRAAEAAAQAIDGLVPPLWSDGEQLRDLVRSLESLEAERRVATLTATIEDAAAACRATSLLRGGAPECAYAASALHARDLSAYASAFAGIEEVRNHQALVERREALLERLRAEAPRLAGELTRTPDDPAWEERLDGFERAWDWARAETWYRSLVSGAEERAVSDRLLVCEERALKLRGELGANLAWRHCLGRMTPEQSQHLRAYQTAMRRFGKGTGKHAATHLAAAQRHMDACQGAVPAWIMPTYRAAETVPARPGAFDVVIVDEASQSGVDALFLLWLAPKIVVVGDDRQISPDNVGMDRHVVDRLQRQHLPDVELRDLLGLDNSLFDQTASRYRGRIWLQEHFRCMPEIIEFSNRLSYSDHLLVPLRQFGTDRLDPVRAVHVPDAVLAGGQEKINDREARAIVEQVARCCADPAYDGATMGVVSLLGAAQAKRIHDLLVERLGPEEIVARRLKCGTAYDFQGDERAVMFLSMVVTPSADGRRLPALGGRGHEQRYNVAASRAQDQLWLFHSVQPHDLNSECVRAKLLAHCLTPPPALDAPEIMGDVRPDILEEPFDSLLEQQVYLRLRERGYTVVAQQRVHGLRIDLVVLGDRARLAVECDGESWHGPDRYALDMARQRDLERCGWRFFRLTASEFSRDPEGALEPLWRVLADRGIRPVAAPAA
jgi:very-short-patch-repair endonuclease